MADTSKMRIVQVIHGPNLNALGKREKDLYGTRTLAEIDADLKLASDRKGFVIETFQSNHEGALVDKIQKIRRRCDGLIINPAAYTHTSIAIRDAVLLLDIPVIEIHLSNIYKREPFRQKSLLADIVEAQICGLGAYGYVAALNAMIHILSPDLNA